MKLDNIRNFPTIDAYVTDKLERYGREAHTLETLYRYMFDENDNILWETTDGYRIRKTTYGEAKARIETVAPAVADVLCGIPEGSLVGLYAANSPEWIILFWAILRCGYNILLMNTRLPIPVLETVIRENKVSAVISDGVTFSVNTVKIESLTAVADKPLCDRFFGEEVIFMSSGTSERVKLCAYTGENFYRQVCDSVGIIRNCPAIKEHYEGELKHLILLPFCHVFGFIAVYLWFGFFSRTFVFPRDLNPATVQTTVKKHKVTHIFAVPMVWEAVHKAAIRKIKSRGEKTYKKFNRVASLVNRLGRGGDIIARKALREVRDGLFGDSIRFLISGGSHISPDTIAFFNGIGYHLANGYGMTEIGITSVERSSVRRILNQGSIGAPFGMTEYAIGDGGELLVRGKTRASRITVGEYTTNTDFDAWFPTGDLADEVGGHYFIKGRRDDLIIGPDGENINPIIAESAIRVAGVDRLCLYTDREGHITLLASVPGCYSPDNLRRIRDELEASLSAVRLERTVNHILLTHDALLRGGEIKLSRTRVAKAVAVGEISAFDASGIDRCAEELLEGVEATVRECFAAALNRPASEIGTGKHFFTELGGTSLEYFALQGEIKSRLGVDIDYNQCKTLFTIKDFTDYVRSH